MIARYYLGEHIANAVQGLRRRGLDVLALAEAGTLGASDEEHFEFARKEGRIIVTHDDDFLRLAAQTMDHAGVVYMPQRRSIGETVRGLTLIADVLGAEGMRGHVEFLLRAVRASSPDAAERAGGSRSCGAFHVFVLRHEATHVDLNALRGGLRSNLQHPVGGRAVGVAFATGIVGRDHVGRLAFRGPAKHPNNPTLSTTSSRTSREGSPSLGAEAIVGDASPSAQHDLLGFPGKA